MSASILIVDDEQPVRYMVRRLLEGQGYTVVEAESGAQGLELVGQTPVDLVITDLKMPGIDGLEMAEELLDADPDRPVLLMTAFGDLESARKAVRVGIYEYFTKPVDINDVVAGVRRALERRRLVQENRAYQKDLESTVEERTQELRQRLKEVEARDELLQWMLSLQAPEETLGLAVKLALDLCGCEVGALFCPDSGGEIRLRAAVGFANADAPVPKEDLDGLGLGRAEEIAQALEETLENHTPVWVHEPDEVRRGFGIHSFGVLPVCRGEEVLGLLEVGRKRRDVLVGEADLEVLQGFLPYVAMAVVDCKLQEQIPEWEEEVHAALEAAEDWTDGQA